ncbi:MAG: hypothetical protein A2677_03555 [Candidatus Komeilibacteria bacterium RIFCSPHIGHO2_01_FULL_52_14]|uniref:PDZ domain-containing protein n=1 Tax=Candidatus Komeilibacteria bacterium RIFCSPHIGHO2_01_FULL_52_14 TaxID=1798549 RepID=A0A1G2BMU1_9BACT|nr:MAG: hypothetical protein A2677_03555 [Candidatus Komeilibacteria bacterium RIFCSPHIGHO2_01_FULL_52_14]
MMNRRFFFFIIGAFAAILFFAGRPALADELTRVRYAGSFLRQDYQGRLFYWYVDPVTQKRFALSDTNAFARLLRIHSVGITTRNLNKIPDATGSTAKSDAALIQRMRGYLLLQVDGHGKTWYVNPLNDRRYALEPTDAGFDVMKTLALDMRDDRLGDIPVTLENGFNLMSFGQTSAEDADLVNDQTYDTMLNLLSQFHLHNDTFSRQDLFYASLTGMAAGTHDPYTEFYTPKQNQRQKAVFQGDSSTIEGIGAYIQSKDKSIYVVSVISGSPAEQAGLLPKDQILAIDGQSTDGVSVDFAVSLIRGAANTTVRLSIYRPSSGVTQEYVVTRRRIDIPTVDASVLDNSIAYLKFSLFSADLPGKFSDALAKVVSSNTQGVIVDLRNNPGGLTQSAALVADLWLTSDQVIYTARERGTNTRYVASDGRQVPLVPTVLLVNEETASAGEILASALHEYHAATIIGARTYGKGTGQTLETFEDGSGLKFTTFEWLPPDGQSIDGKGITPDIAVQDTGSGDSQLDRAKQFIRFGF